MLFAVASVRAAPSVFSRVFLAVPYVERPRPSRDNSAVGIVVAAVVVVFFVVRMYSRRTSEVEGRGRGVVEEHKAVV